MIRDRWKKQSCTNVCMRTFQMITSNKNPWFVYLHLGLKDSVDFRASCFKRTYTRVIEQHFAAKALESRGSPDWHLQLLCFAPVAMPLWSHQLWNACFTASGFRCCAVSLWPFLTFESMNSPKFPGLVGFVSFLEAGDLKKGLLNHQCPLISPEQALICVWECVFPLGGGRIDFHTLRWLQSKWTILAKLPRMARLWLVGGSPVTWLGNPYEKDSGICRRNRKPNKPPIGWWWITLLNIYPGSPKTKLCPLIVGDPLHGSS